ncbi:cytochrome P450 1A1-like [Haliotis asinina]|uniref:cytochrome P450 1A1-like n=1 Tax=Haliotis asinina TaxID=109174 RepID=UPI003531BF27
MSEEVHNFPNCLATVFDFPTLFTFFLTCLIIYIFRKFCVASGINVLPGPWCLPLVGYFPFLGEKAHLTLTRLGNNYGPAFRLSLGMSEVIVINSRQLAKEALVGKGDDFADRPRLKLLSILPTNATYSLHPFDELGQTFEDISETFPETVSKGFFLSMNAIFGAATFPPLSVLEEAFRLMAVYPDVQQRVRKEIHSVVSSDQRPGWQDRSSLPFSEAVLLETLRFRPPDTVMLPHSTLRNTSLHGCDIKKGTIVLFNIHAMNFDQTDWHRPEEYLPERFLDCNGKVDQGSRSKLMSFSAGERKCIGEAFGKMELFLFFIGLLQKCEFIQRYSETDSSTISDNILVRLV